MKRNALSLSAAVSMLRAFQPISLSSAVSALEDDLQSILFLKFFQLLFPEKFRAFRGTGKQSIKELCRLIDIHLFPINEDWLEALLDDLEDSGLNWIPILEINEWAEVIRQQEDYGDYLRRFGTAERVALFMASGFENQSLMEGIELRLWTTGLPAPIAWMKNSLHEEWFDQRCEAIHPCLKGFGETLDALAGNSGNFWIDIDSDGLNSSPLEWSLDTIYWLTSEFIEAKEILETTRVQFRFLDEHPWLITEVVRAFEMSIFDQETKTPRLPPWVQPPLCPSLFTTPSTPISGRVGVS